MYAAAEQVAGVLGVIASTHRMTQVPRLSLTCACGSLRAAESPFPNIRVANRALVSAGICSPGL